MANVQRFTREEYIADRWDYKRGEHVSFLGSTGNGKTTLALQLLKATATQEVPGIVLAMKPKDKTVTDFHKLSGFRKVDNWPPTPSMWKPQKPEGYILWPKTTFDIDVDDAHHADVFRRCMIDSYKKGNRILFADEAYSLAEELGIGKSLITLWTKGRSMGTGLWAATQKPTHVPLWMYSQASHLFLSYDPDKRARDRYREISGADPEVIQQALLQTDPFEWVAVKPAGRQSTICIVGA